MAIDTPSKRRAMMGLGGVRRLPVANGSFDAFDRAMFLGNYLPGTDDSYIEEVPVNFYIQMTSENGIRIKTISQNNMTTKIQAAFSVQL